MKSKQLLLFRLLMLYIFLFVSYGVSNLRGFLSAEPNQGAYRVVFAPNI